MRVFIIGRTFIRVMLIILLLLLILPLLQYYTLKAVNPQTVHFREPRGEAIKVSVDGVEEEKHGVFPRFLYYLNEFYQNGL